MSDKQNAPAIEARPSATPGMYDIQFVTDAGSSVSVELNLGDLLGLSLMTANGIKEAVDNDGVMSTAVVEIHLSESRSDTMPPDDPDTMMTLPASEAMQSMINLQECVQGAFYTVMAARALLEKTKDQARGKITLPGRQH